MENIGMVENIFKLNRKRSLALVSLMDQIYEITTVISQRVYRIITNFASHNQTPQLSQLIYTVKQNILFSPLYLLCKNEYHQIQKPFIFFLFGQKYFSLLESNSWLIIKSDTHSLIIMIILTDDNAKVLEYYITVFYLVLFSNFPIHSIKLKS